MSSSLVHLYDTKPRFYKYKFSFTDDYPTLRKIFIDVVYNDSLSLNV